jgi:hypothetical protein
MFFRNFPFTTYQFDENGVNTKIADIFRYVHTTDQIIDDANSYKFYQIHDGERPDVVSYKLYGTPDYYWTLFIVNDSLHKGIRGWPLSNHEFNTYMENQYNGVVINGRPQIVYDSDGNITDFRDSIADRFKIGETVIGSASGAKGTLIEKDLKNNQLVIENVTGTFRTSEFIKGETTEDFITSFEVFSRDQAPKYYKDLEGRETVSALFVAGGTPHSECTIYSNREYEEELNDEHSSIRVIRPEFIEQFALRYKRLINQ